MRIVKPGWVNHDGKPIFSIDIHPDGSRFATGGQGDDYGKIIIWNMAPVREEAQEKADNVPKVLCQMDNHYACVNCVRWSRNGKFLASGGDDKLVMVWQTSRGAGPSKAFGSAGSVVIHEQWRPVHTLRGHSGDVLDLNWSPQDVWLATCSVDNTIIVWNALNFPEQVAVLKGHTGMVKGVTWDPVGKYLATQSDDRSVRVWRTMDWKQESSITEPFKECGGTTHALRLSWSPDGHHIVSAHAMNNSGPTAQIIEREGFKASLDFVGHRKAITTVKFNPNMFSKDPKSKKDPYSCCAVGSKDRSISVWLTCLKRPLVVMHDIFENSVLDLSWGPNGLELMTCSIDGSVGLLEFSAKEIGHALSKDDMTKVLENVFGKSISLNMAASKGAQIIESAAMLNLQEQQKHKSNNSSSNLQVTPSKHSNMSSSQLSIGGEGTPFKPVDKQIETRTADGRRRITPIFLAPQPELGEAPLPFPSASPSIGFHSSSEKSKIRVERQDRVTAPGMMSPSSGSLGSKSAPSPPVRDTSGSQSQMQALATRDTNTDKTGPKPPETTPEKSAKNQQSQNETTPGKSTLQKPSIVVTNESSPGAKPPSSSEKDIEKSKSPMAASLTLSEKLKPSTAEKEKLKTKMSGGLSLKRKFGDDKHRYRFAKRGRPSKADQAARDALIAADAAKAGLPLPVARELMSPATPVAATATPTPHTTVPASPAVTADMLKALRTPTLKLPVLSLGKSASRPLPDQPDVGSAATLVVENSEEGLGRLHRLRLVKAGAKAWEQLLTSAVAAVHGSRHVVCAACANGAVNVFSLKGRRLLPPLVTGAPPSVLTSNGHHVMAITTAARLFVWNCQLLKTTLSRIPLDDIMSEKESIEQAIVTNEGIPVITLTNKKSFCYSLDIENWTVMGEASLASGSAHQNCTPSKLRPLGPLANISKASRPSEAAPSSLGSGSRQTLTISHLESQVAGARVLRSGPEWRFWLETYIRYLAQEGIEDKLREVCDELLGPVYKSKAKTWNRYLLGVDRHDVLRKALPAIGADLKFQRLYTEYKDQLDLAQG